MSEEAGDLCECLCSHEIAMTRLLNMLRESQDYCTDNECLTELPDVPATASNNFMMMVVCWIAVALILFMWRPNSLRNRTEKTKNNNGQGPNGPSPPPLTN